jgi:hypothetical protein
MDHAMDRRGGYQGSVDVEYAGRTHYGRFVVEGKIIRVSYEGLQKTAQLGNSPPDLLAKIMLRELAVRASAGQEVDPELSP